MARFVLIVFAASLLAGCMTTRDIRPIVGPSFTYLFERFDGAAQAGDASAAWALFDAANARADSDDERFELNRRAFALAASQGDRGRGQSTAQALLASGRITDPQQLAQLQSWAQPGSVTVIVPGGSTVVVTPPSSGGGAAPGPVTIIVPTVPTAVTSAPSAPIAPAGFRVPPPPAPVAPDPAATGIPTRNASTTATSATPPTEPVKQPPGTPWWQTLIVTLTALIGAITALLVAIRELRKRPDPEPVPKKPRVRKAKAAV